MPIGKNIYKKLSKKHGKRRERSLEVAKKRLRSGLGPQEPPTVDQYKKNIVVRVKSHDVHITELANSKRQVSPNEGMPAVNGKSGQEIVEKAVKKVGTKKTEIDPTAGAILPVDKKKTKKSTSGKKPVRRCSSCNQTGHTKRSCPTKS